MARTFAKTHVSIWGDDDFLNLSPMAQWLFWHLYTQPELSYCGVTDWRPGRIIPKASGLTTDVLDAAADELAQAVYIVIDEATEEVLVRSFIRNDELLKQKNMGAAVAKAYSAVASRDLRGVVVHELKRLHAENPKWTSWEALDDVLRKRSVNPFDDAPERGSGNPSIKGSGNPLPHGPERVSRWVPERDGVTTATTTTPLHQQLLIITRT